MFGAAIVATVALYLGVAYLFFRNVTVSGPVHTIHVAAAALATGIGAVQFLPEIRNRYRQWHHRIGRTHAGAALIAGTIASFAAVRGLHGFPSAKTVGLDLAGLLWVITTGAGFCAICRGDVAAHRRWMARSYALALFPITLRIYQRCMVGLGIYGEIADVVLYWAAWVPNLAAAEWFARLQVSGPSSPQEPVR